MRTCAQAHTLSHSINTVLYTPDGVPEVYSPTPPSSIHLCSTIFSPQLWLAAPTREFQPSRKPCQLWTMECVCVCVWVGGGLFRLYEQVFVYACTTLLCILTINEARLALSPLHQREADRRGCCCDLLTCSKPANEFLSTHMASPSQLKEQWFNVYLIYLVKRKEKSCRGDSSVV